MSEQTARMSVAGTRAAPWDWARALARPLARVQVTDWILTLATFAGSFYLYARTMAPGLLDGDEGEFQINMFRLGVSHTGYPTFFLLGKLWMFLVPIGTMATRANLFSAFWGAVTIAAVYLSIQVLTRNRWASIITALLLLGSRVEWSQAIIPRPYTLNSLFVVLVPTMFFLWRMGKVDLTVPVFAFGMSLTNHRTIMWFGPALAFFVLAADYHEVIGGYYLKGSLVSSLREWITKSTLLKPKRLLVLIGAFVLPLVLYGYVWWRGESDVGVEFHWKDFNDEILGGYVRASWRFGPLDWLISRVTELYIPMQIEQFTAFGFAAGLVGMAALALDRAPRFWPKNLPPREVLVALILSSLANTAFGVIFWVIDIDKFFLPSFITILFFTGVGIAVIWDWLNEHRARWASAGALILVFAAGIGFLFRQNYPLNDWSNRNDVARTWAENLAQPLEPNAIIAGSWESITPLEYAMYVDGRRRDLERWKLIIKNYQLGQVPYGSRQEDIEKAVREGRQVYLTIYPGETETLGALVDEFRLARVGELWRVVNLPPRDTAMEQKLQASKPIATFADKEGQSLELLGYVSTPASVQTGALTLTTLYWRVPQSVTERLAISFRLTDADNHLIVQRDLEPGSGLRPTNGWMPGEVVQDDIGWIMPPDAPPGNYHMSLVVYSSATGENWTTGTGSLVNLGDLQVTRSSSAVPRETLSIPNSLNTALPPLRLLGYGLSDEQPKGGDLLDLSLWWQADKTTGDTPISIGVRGTDGKTIEMYQGAPTLGYPVTEWNQAAILRGRYSLPLPLTLSGAARLIVQVNGNSTELPIPNVRPSGRTFTVPQVTHPQAAQLSDSIKFLGYDLDKTSARPGDKVRLTLYWQALKPSDRSYTVFAHALDSNGILRGQQDSIPRGGELATNRWIVGEVVADTYEIVLASDAPAGDYAFEVGMYLGETGTRVPVTDANGSRLQDDRVILDTKLAVR